MESAKSTATYKFVLDIVLTVVVTLVWGSSVRRLRILNFQSCDHPMALQHDSTAAGWRISECSPAVQGRYVPFVCQTHSTVTKIVLDTTTSEGGHDVRTTRERGLKVWMCCTLSFQRCIPSHLETCLLLWDDRNSRAITVVRSTTLGPAGYPGGGMVRKVAASIKSQSQVSRCSGSPMGVHLSMKLFS